MYILIHVNIVEIEHFVDPTDKTHPRFAAIKDEVLTLFPGEAQLTTGRCVQMTAGEAVANGTINNETLAYFMTRTQQWLLRIGVRREKMRFRQHLKTEMAHYAADCWDTEIQMSYGWIECVGHADRACYDLQQHSKRTGVPLQASARLATPQTITRMVAVPNKRLLGPRFKTDQKTVLQALEALEGDELVKFKTDIETKNEALLPGDIGPFMIQSDLVTFETETKTVSEMKFTPSVIEPSYGVGRILYAVLEHSFSQRMGDEQRCVMSFKPCVAPIKVGIFPLTNFAGFTPLVGRLREWLQVAGLANKVDASSGTVGRRYARADELGIPFGVTIDFQSLLDDSVTVRDRDSMAQIRVPLARLTDLLRELVAESISWTHVMNRFVVVNAGGNVDNDNEDDDGPSTSVETKTVKSNAATVVESSPRARFSRPNLLLASSVVV